MAWVIVTKNGGFVTGAKTETDFVSEAAATRVKALRKMATDGEFNPVIRRLQGCRNQNPRTN